MYKHTHIMEHRLLNRDFNRPPERRENDPASEARLSQNSEQQEDKRRLTSGSIANAPHAIADALVAAEEVLGKDREWELPPRGEKGEQLKRALPGLKKQLAELGSELVHKAAQGANCAKVINDFLQNEKGMDRLLDESMNADFAVASVLDILVKWATKGEKTKMKMANDNTEVDAVSMQDVDSVFDVPGYPEPIVQINTENEYEVYMVRYDGPIPKDSTSLFELVHHLSRSKQAAEPGTYKGVTFPMVDFSEQGDIQELLGAKAETTEGEIAEIDQAKFQHRLRMNEVGARAEAAAAIGGSRGIDRSKPVVIDGPFIVWFEKNGVIPFSARITEEHMKEPESLE